jgi:O-antigen ligase
VARKAGDPGRARGWFWIGLGATTLFALLSYPLLGGGVGLAGLTALALARWRVLGRAVPSSPFTIPLGLYLAGALVGSYVGVAPREGTIRLFGLLAALASYVFVLDVVNSAARARQLAQALLLAVIVTAPLVLILITPFIETKRLLIPLPEWLASWLGSLTDLARSVSGGDSEAWQRFRFHRSGLSTLAAFGVGLALGPVLGSAQRRERLLGLLAVGFLGAFLLLAGTRGHLLSAVTVALLLGLASYRTAPRAALTCAAAVTVIVAGAAAGLAGLLPRWATSFDTLDERFEFWRQSAYLLGDFPFSGAGLGIPSVAAVYNVYFPPVNFRFYHSHNIFLQSYLEQGVLGLLGLVAIVGVALAIGWRTVAAARSSEARSAALSAGGGALALVLCGLTDVDALTSIGMVLLFVALGLLVAAGRAEQAGPEQAGGFRQLVARLPPLGGARRGALAGLLAAPVLGGLVLAQAVGPRSSGAESLSGPLDRLAAAVYLNLGAVELSRATLHVSGPNVLEARLSPEVVDQQGLARAAWVLGRAHEHAPDEPRGYLVRAALALARSDPAATTALLADAESMAAGGDSHFSFQLGRLYREAGEVERAVVAWSTDSREIGPVTRNGPDAQLIQWGIDLLRLERWREATLVSQVAVRAAPDDPDAYAVLSIATVRDGGEDAAAATFEQLAEEYATVPWPYVELSRIFARAGRGELSAWWSQRAASVQSSGAWHERMWQAIGDRRYPVRIAGRSSQLPHDLGSREHHRLGPIAVVVGSDARTLLVQNVGGQVYDVALEMVYKLDEAEVATTRGTMQSLAAGQLRVLRLDAAAPSQWTTRELLASWERPAEGSRRAELTAGVTFGSWYQISDFGFDVDVSTSNLDAHPVLIQALLLRDNLFVGVATGQLTELEPEQTRRITLLAGGPLPRYDEIMFVAEAVDG